MAVRWVLAGAARRAVDDLNARIAPYRLQDIVPLLAELYSGLQLSLDGGIAVSGDGGCAGRLRVLRVPSCWEERE